MKDWHVIRLPGKHYKLLGPMTKEQLENEIKTGSISISDLVYQPKLESPWIRIYDIPQFLDAEPPMPSAEELASFTKELEPPQSASEPDTTSKSKTSMLGNKKPVWYLQFEGNEFGAFTMTELGRILDSGKLNGETYVWKEGLQNWLLVKGIEELLSLLPQAMEDAKKLVIELGANKRAYLRTAIIATFSISHEEKTYTGICADISEDGLQGIQFAAPLSFGYECTVVVTPLGVQGVKAFKVRSRVSWIDGDSKKVGFKFLDHVSDASLTKYLKNAQKKLG
jgi:hypothetical protein